MGVAHVGKLISSLGKIGYLLLGLLIILFVAGLSALQLALSQGPSARQVQQLVSWLE